MKETEEQVYSDFDVQFRRNMLTGDIVKKVNTESIKQSLNLLFKTQFYDRKWKPYIGSYLQGLLFKQDDPYTREICRSEIDNMIKNYEPRVKIENIEFYYESPWHEDNRFLTVKIEYYVVDLGIRDTFIYSINRVR